MKVSTSRFRQLRHRAVQSIGLALSVLAGLYAQAAVAAPTLYLPFTGGRTMTVTQYPHTLSNPYMGYAMDIGMALNEPIWAAAGGTVVVAGADGNYDPSINGNQVIINHGNDFCTQYNHLNWVAVRRGQTVTRGQNLGGAGATGLAYGVHLHFNTIYCSTLKTRGPITTAEYPGGFYNGQRITSRNSQGLPYGLKGAIGDRWEADGGLSYYGEPVTGEVCGLRNGGCYQRFEKAQIHWSPGTGAWGTRGAIRGKWGVTGWEDGKLGYPVGKERCGLRGGGCGQLFEYGTIMWASGAAYAYYTKGAIEDRWRAYGSENSFLGYPIMDERGGLKDGGAYQHFEGGHIHWSPATGAHATRGGIRDLWEQLDWENGWLGYPITEEYTDQSGNRAQNFQGGRIHWNSTRGAWAVRN